MDFNHFDDDFDWEDNLIIGGFIDYMMDQEKLDKEEGKRKQDQDDLVPDSDDQDIIP